MESSAKWKKLNSENIFKRKIWSVYIPLREIQEVKLRKEILNKPIKPKSV